MNIVLKAGILLVAVSDAIWCFVSFTSSQLAKKPKRDKATPM